MSPTDRAPYGRTGKYAPPIAAGGTPVTYYGRPQLKPSHYGLRVGLYMFVAGLSGAAQMIAAAADLAGGEGSRDLVRRGRYLSLLGIGLGPPLLIWDLHTPQRFYNMLRIFRPTSPMSIGTYILSGFSLFAGATAGAQFLADRRGGGWRRLARTAQLPAAFAGAGMTCYTAALLSATSTPFWAAAPRALAVQFAGSAVAAGAAALELTEGPAAASPAGGALEAIGLAAAAVGFAGAIAAGSTRSKLGLAPHRPWDVVQLAASGLGAALPLAFAVGGRPRRRLAQALALAALAGSLVLRAAVIEAGNASARRPTESLRFAGRENLR